MNLERDLPPGWRTDLAVLEHAGSIVVDRGDHLVVRTRHNPGYHWGNFVLVTAEDAVNDAERWIRAFRAAMPAASWVAVGLIRMPDDRGAWASRGLDVDLDDVLSTRTLPRQRPLPPAYTVRRLVADDWALLAARAVAENDRTGDHDPDSFLEFASRRVKSQRVLSERGIGAFFGAFAGDSLVASLGIVRCGATARYQSVGTDAEHRRRGLAAHLLGVAARWSADHGCHQWVIVTEATNPAGRIYRSVGFERDIGNAQAYRKPPR